MKKEYLAPELELIKLKNTLALLDSSPIVPEDETPGTENPDGW